MNNQAQTVLWRSPVIFWILLAVSAVLIGYAFQIPIEHMLGRWNKQEEYGYGYLIPVILMFLIWQRKNQLADWRAC